MALWIVETITSLLLTVTITEVLMFVVFVFGLNWIHSEWWLTYEKTGPNGEPLPPGPMPFPIFGNIPQLESKLFLSFSKLQESYGDICRVRLGRQEVIIVNGYNMLYNVFLRKSAALAGRPNFDVFQKIAKGKSISFISRTSRWDLHKRGAYASIAELVRSHRDVAERSIHEHITGMCQKLLVIQSGQDVIDPRDIVKAAVLNVLVSNCFGNASNLSQVCSDIQKELTIFDESVMPAMMSELAPSCMRPLMQWAINRSEIALDKYYEFIEDLIQSNLKGHETSATRHVLDIMYRWYERQDQRSLESVGLTRTQLLHSVDDLIGAGHETMANFIHWAILYLAKFPNTQDRLYEETKKIDIDSISYNHRHTVPYIEAFILELARHSSFSPNTIPHGTMTDITVGGYYIPKDTIVIGNFDSVYKNPEHFTDPYDFQPERFLDESGQINHHLAKYVPMFGLGKRRCLGETLARYNMFVSLVHMVRCCEYVENPDHPLELHKGEYTIVFRAYRYKINVRAREI